VADFTVEDDGASDAFARKATAALDALVAKVNDANNALADRVRGKLSGEVLQVRDGKLLGSVHVIPANVDGDEIAGYVEAGGPEAPYAKVQEYGGRNSYDILPVNKKALAFPGGAYNPETISFSKSAALGQMVVVKKVHHPALAERSFMRAAVDEMRAEIVASLEGLGGRDVNVSVR